MALIFPHEANLRHFLSTAKLVDVDPSADLSTLCHNKAVVDAVLKDCNAAGKKAGFKPLEILEAVVLTPEEWTTENDLLTAAQKIQRKKIAQRYDKEIKVGLYRLGSNRELI